MTKIIEAIVQGDTLKPLQKLGLPENERVLITVMTLCDRPAEREESFYEAAMRLGAIGIAKDTPPDLSTNPAHLNGFGS